MGTTISAAAKVELAKPRVRLEKRVTLIRDLMNADLRTEVDVKPYLVNHGIVGGDSTIKSKTWSKPTYQPSFQIDEALRYMLPGSATSVWTALGASVTDCFLRFETFIPLPNGSLEVVKTWLGKIVDYKVRNEGGIHQIDLVTEHPSAEQLAAGITKATGDALVKLGGSW